MYASAGVGPGWILINWCTSLLYKRALGKDMRRPGSRRVAPVHCYTEAPQDPGCRHSHVTQLDDYPCGIVSDGDGRRGRSRSGGFGEVSPGHDTPKRARAYLLTDQVVTETAAHYANSRPGLDTESQHAIRTANDLGDSTADGPAGDIQVPELSDSAGDRSGPSGPDEALWLALCLAPDEGTDVGELLRLTGMSRPTLYRRLAEHAKAGRAVQVSRGRWRALTTEEPPR